MGFPNVDLFLVDKLIERFTAAQDDDNFVINDTFPDLDISKRNNIGYYVNKKFYTSDTRDRRGDSCVYVLPHFPLNTVPLPQIGISLGNEASTNRVLADMDGASTPVYAKDGVTIAYWNVTKGYYASASYTIDVVAMSKEEVIWLSRLVQRFICELQDALSAIAVYEIDINLSDVNVQQESNAAPIWSRAVTVSCTVGNTWNTKVTASTVGDTGDTGDNSAYTYETGVNTYMDSIDEYKD